VTFSNLTYIRAGKFFLTMTITGISLFLFMFLLRNFGADYVATGVIVEAVYQLTVLIA
jgi:uncharacterized membrane protein